MQELPSPDLGNIQDERYPKLMAFSPDGQLVSFIVNTSIQIWDLQKQESVSKILFTPDSSYLLHLNRDGSMDSWKIPE